MVQVPTSLINNQGREWYYSDNEWGGPCWDQLVAIKLDAVDLSVNGTPSVGTSLLLRLLVAERFTWMIITRRQSMGTSYQPGPFFLTTTITHSIHAYQGCAHSYISTASMHWLYIHTLTFCELQIFVCLLSPRTSRSSLNIPQLHRSMNNLIVLAVLTSSANTSPANLCFERVVH